MAEVAALFEQVLYRELRGTYREVASHIDMLDRLMRDAYLNRRSKNKKYRYSRHIADYIPRRLGWYVGNLQVGGHRPMLSVHLEGLWIPLFEPRLPGLCALQRLISRWYFELGNTLAMFTDILHSEQILRGKDAANQLHRLPAWESLRPPEEPLPLSLQAFESLYTCGALAYVEGVVSLTKDAAELEARYASSLVP